MAIDAVLRKAGRRSAMLTGGSLLVPAALATLFRMPQFINSDTVNSDSAIVGLQAIELLRGADWSWFLWGTGYQSSLDPLLTAVAFAAFGTSSLVLMAVNFLGALLAMSLCFSMLQARVGAARAFVLTLLLVFVSQPMVLITTLPPRQWSITAFFLAIALADRAAHGRAFARVMLGVSGALMCLALYIDYGPVQFFLPSVWLLFASCRDQTPDSRARAGRMWSAAIGLAVGSLFLIGSRLFLHPEGTVPIAFKPRVVGHNVDMLFTQALPSLMGTPPISWMGHGRRRRSSRCSASACSSCRGSAGGSRGVTRPCPRQSGSSASSGSSCPSSRFWPSAGFPRSWTRNPPAS